MRAVPAQPWRPMIAAGPLLVGLSLGLQLALLAAPLLTMHVFDGVLQSGNTATLGVLALAYAGAVLLGGLLRWLRGALLAALAEHVGRGVQLGALVAAVRVSVAGDAGRAGLAIADAAEQRRLLNGPLAADLLDALTVPLALAFLWLLHPAFCLAAIIACAAKGAIGLALAQATRPALAQATEAESRNLSALVARLGQRDLVLGLGLLSPVVAQWRARQDAAVAAHDEAQHRAAALQALAQLVGFALQMSVVAIGAVLLLRDAITPGAMLAAATLVGFAANPFAALAGLWREWSAGSVAWQRSRRLMADAAPPPVAPRDDAAPDGLVLRGLVVARPGGGAPLIQALDLHLRPGEAWMLTGPNGAGKTTLVRTVMGLAAPQAGCTLLDGADTARTPREEIGPRIGYLPQEPALLEGSVLDNIARFAPDATEMAVAAARRAGAHAMIGRLPAGYETPAGPGAALSGGQRRLVALARAVFGPPRLVVLDEPEAGLDEASRDGLRRAVAELREAGAVVLLVTHAPDAWRAALDGEIRLDGAGGCVAERRR